MSLVWGYTNKLWAYYDTRLMYSRGFHKCGYPNSWMVSTGKILWKLRLFWGAPIYGTPHIHTGMSQTWGTLNCNAPPFPNESINSWTREPQITALCSPQQKPRLKSSTSSTSWCLGSSSYSKTSWFWGIYIVLYSSQFRIFRDPFTRIQHLHSPSGRSPAVAYALGSPVQRHPLPAFAKSEIRAVPVPCWPWPWHGVASPWRSWYPRRPVTRLHHPNMKNRNTESPASEKLGAVDMWCFVIKMTHSTHL